MEEILSLIDIYAGYGKKIVLEGTSFSVKNGEKILLAGPNGSGKSTLLKVISGIIKIQSGNILYEGKEIHSISAYKRIRKGIGYLAQSNNIFPSLTISENLRIAFWEEKNEKLNYYEEKLFDLFPFLKDFKEKRAGILSGGQRQALAVGMVLLKEKKLYLLDEPTAGLSPKASEEILEVIKIISKEKNSAFILVEHNLRWVKDWYDRIIVMREGKFISEIQKDLKVEIKEILERYYFE